MAHARPTAKRTKKKSHVVHRRGRNGVNLPISKPASCTAARLPSEFLRGRYASSQAQILTTHALEHRRHRSHREAGHGEARENPLATSPLTAAGILPARIPFRSRYTRSDGGGLYPKSRIGEAPRAAARR